MSSKNLFDLNPKSVFWQRRSDLESKPQYRIGRCYSRPFCAMARPHKGDIPLPESCRNMIQFVCSCIKEAVASFGLSRRQAQAVLSNKPTKVTPEQLDLIQSVCANEIKYALPTRIESLIRTPQYSRNFVLWVNSAAAMLDMFRSIKAIQDQCHFINATDPFLVSLYHMAASMDEVEDFLVQLHRKCPQFDELFFRGTRFLETQPVAAQPPVSRVPSSVDVLSLSPEDERIYEQLKEQR